MDPVSANWVLTQALLETEIDKVRKAKAEHSGEKRKNRMKIGFQPG